MAAHAIEIDWASASVEDAGLTVGLTGEPPSEWKDGFERVLERLHGSGSGWGAIAVEERGITVAEVTPGAEGDLRHLLESAAMQANASAELEDEEPSGEDDDGDASASPDQAMTETFRSFA